MTLSRARSGASDRIFSMGVWAWLAIVEKERDKLSEGAQSALGLLREDLELIAQDSPRGGVADSRSRSGRGEPSGRGAELGVTAGGETSQ